MQVRNVLHHSCFIPQACCYIAAVVNLIFLQRSNHFSNLALKLLVFSFLVKSWNQGTASKIACGYDCNSLANRIRVVHYSRKNKQKNQNSKQGQHI